MAMLDVRAMTVSFDGVAAVDDVSLAVGKGEVVAVLGPSGSGKSTLLRAIAGLQPADTGAVAVEDADVTRIAAHRRGVGLMFQAPTLFPNRDVAGNVGFGPRMSGAASSVTAARVSELLDLVGLPGFEQRRVDTLSGGEAQRVALARTLAPEPRLLLLDEPFGALDAELRARLVEDVGRLVRRLGLTVVAVTHDREEAYALADRVLVMRAGRIVADGTPEQLWAAPADAWVARFLGMPNVLAANIADGVARTAWGDLAVPRSASGTHVVVPSTAVRLDDPTGVPATVVSRAFAGESVRLALRRTPVDHDRSAGDRVAEVPAELVAEVPVAGAPALESTVHVHLAPHTPVILAN